MRSAVGGRPSNPDLAQEQRRASTMGPDKMLLPIQPTFAPMEAKLVAELPKGPEWQYEPKWDGFRCLAFKDRVAIDLRSKAGQPFNRYFPEIVAALVALDAPRFVLDGELVIP